MQQIVKSINVLIAIEWGRQAWDKVSETTIKNCFQKTGLYPQDEVIEDHPFDGEELQDLQTLVSRIDEQCTVEDFDIAGNDIAECSGYIDTSDPNWSKVARDELLSEGVEVLSIDASLSVCGDDDFDKEVEQPDEQRHLNMERS